MTHEVDLRTNVLLYGQEQCIWCGAASAQMIMNGYPNPADRLFYSQQHIWNVIQANNSTDSADTAWNWATDPKGLRQCLRTLNPPPGGDWNVYKEQVMFNILFWMNRNHYPVATLINEGGHWVVIVRCITDVEPVSGSSPTLQWITKYDPEPHNLGSESTMSGTTWYATDWNGPVKYTGSWYNKYVAVIEPPTAKGRVKAMEAERTGEKVISPEEAIKYARKAIDEHRLYEIPRYAILRKEGIRNLQPILVREEIRPGLEEEIKVPHYYIVPFGLDREIGDCGVPLARISIMVNAFTGRFEEITAFGRPVRYLPEREAVNIAAKAMNLRDKEIEQMLAEKLIRASVMYQPSDITHIRAYPFWKITVKQNVLYVDQLGVLYSTIKPSVPGD